VLVTITVALAAVAVLTAIVVVAVGGGGELSAEHPDHPPLALPGRRAVGGTDAALLRLPLGLWGYHKQITDEALERFAYELTERDTRIAVLEQELAEVRQGLRRDGGGDTGDTGDRRPALPAGPRTTGDPFATDQDAAAAPGDPWKTIADRRGDAAARPDDAPAADSGFVPPDGARRTVADRRDDAEDAAADRKDDGE
jgi:hypothetical protein